MLSKGHGLRDALGMNDAGINIGDGTLSTLNWKGNADAVEMMARIAYAEKIMMMCLVIAALKEKQSMRD